MPLKYLSLCGNTSIITHQDPTIYIIHMWTISYGSWFKSDIVRKKSDSCLCWVTGRDNGRLGYRWQNTLILVMCNFWHNLQLVKCGQYGRSGRRNNKLQHLEQKIYLNPLQTFVDTHIGRLCQKLHMTIEKDVKTIYSFH
jgi:hypothetical protein